MFKSIFNILIYLSLCIAISEIGSGQTVINVRSDTTLSTPSDSVFILKREIQANPTDAELHLKLGNIYLQRERLDDAEILYPPHPLDYEPEADQS